MSGSHSHPLSLSLRQGEKIYYGTSGVRKLFFVSCCLTPGGFCNNLDIDSSFYFGFPQIDSGFPQISVGIC